MGAPLGAPRGRRDVRRWGLRAHEHAERLPFGAIAGVSLRRPAPIGRNSTYGHLLLLQLMDGPQRFPDTLHCFCFTRCTETMNSYQLSPDAQTVFPLLPQAMDVGVALPTWLFTRDSKLAPLMLLGLVFCGILLPLGVASWHMLNSNKYSGPNGVMQVRQSVGGCDREEALLKGQNRACAMPRGWRRGHTGTQWAGALT